MNNKLPWKTRVITALYRQWYQQLTWAILFLPLAWVYQVIVTLKSYRSPKKIGKVPVICVGNLLVGGGGKTPTVLWLAEQLTDHGFTVGIVLTGYGRQQAEGKRVQMSDASQLVGDEAMLYAKRGFSVYVGSRKAGIRALQSVDCIVCDDGLHAPIRYQFCIQVEKAGHGIGNGHYLPVGPRRQGPPPPGCLSVVTGGRAIHPVADYALTYQLTGIYQGEHRLPSNCSQPIYAVCGIAHPGDFFDGLKQLGYSVIPRPFPDHHPFKPSDFADFPEESVIVMTEKDWVKCQSFGDKRLWVAPLTYQPTPALQHWLQHKVLPALLPAPE